MRPSTFPLAAMDAFVPGAEEPLPAYAHKVFDYMPQPPQSQVKRSPSLSARPASQLSPK
ncbi:hypothetical protein C2845_PM17G04450 [Panicum miliaceum]|uniref:Uncharacterized protein n=1 Tax=Panicum miliaceum TaxID=4540 RepID=A0A3L6Q210_PANMI|nr:hypothetical protein C2845_PM17G04450 [Panicum miliaceum]